MSLRAGSATLRQPCHFGEWLQGRLGAEGPVALVTLLPEGVGLRARRMPSEELAVTTPQLSAGFPAPAPVLRRFLHRLGLPTHGRFLLSPTFPPGLGTGVSTASLSAIARLAGFCGLPEVLARACLAVEGASDPLMFPQADRLLWASRQGRVLGRLPAVPRAHLLVGFFGPALPTSARDQDYDDISDLVAAWRKAQSLGDCAAIARDSASRCLTRRGPVDDPTAQLARDLGALGWAASHSGAARALIFAPGTLPLRGAALMREAGLRNLRALATGG
jgi:uncharacterized protein involved in propanediol utilization